MVQQIPDLRSALNIVDELKKKQNKQRDIRYMLSDQVYAKARLAETDKVLLWLGVSQLNYSWPIFLMLCSNRPMLCWSILCRTPKKRSTKALVLLSSRWVVLKMTWRTYETKLTPLRFVVYLYFHPQYNNLFFTCRWTLLECTTGQ